MSITIPEKTRSFYMGIFYGLVMFSGVLGGFFTALMFDMIATGVVVAILGIICIFGAIPPYFLPDAREDELTESFLARNSGEEVPANASVISTVYRPPIYLLLPIFAYTGIFNAYSISIFP
jgi:hypothetical protein